MPDYFTLAELRALPDMDNVARYPDARVEIEAAFVVARIELTVGTSFVARTVTSEVQTLTGDQVLLDEPYVLSVTSATESGVAVTDQLRVEHGILRRYAAGGYRPLSWTPAGGTISVTYQAGYSSTPPADIKSVALQWTRLRLLTTDSRASNDARATSASTESGTLQFIVAGPDQPSGYPEIDATLVAWRDRLAVVSGFA